jgi:hypothetical protein
MTTKKLLFHTAMICVGALLTFSSCKKKDPATTTPAADESGQSSSDSRQAISENDASINDVTQTLGDNQNMHGRLSSTQKVATTICGLTIDTVGSYMGTIKLNYNGTVCNNRKRDGSIKLTIINYASGARWKNAGCVLQVDYLAYKVTRASDGQSIEINGTQMLTNISGGTWVDLVLNLQPNLVNSVTGTNLNVKFNGTATAIYNINRKFTYTWASSTSVLSCSGEGIGSSGGLSNLENYGTTRDGDGFTSQVITPILWNTTCGWGAPLAGELDIKVASKSFDLNCLFGVNSSGTPITVGSNQCAYGWKLTWTVGTTSQNKVIVYY